MLKALCSDETIDFVSAYDSDKENPTVFKLGVLTARDRVSLMLGMEDDAKKGGAIYDVMKKGVKEIKNLGGKDITIIDDSALNLVPTKVLEEVFNRLVAVNFISEAEEKN